MEHEHETQGAPAPAPGAAPSQQVLDGLDTVAASAPAPEPAPGTASEPAAPAVEHAWHEVVEEGWQDIEANAPNWRFPKLGAKLMRMGVEKYLDKLLPGGLDDLEAKMGAWGPGVCIGIGLGIIVLHNLEKVAQPDGSTRLRIKPLELPPAKKEGASA